MANFVAFEDYDHPDVYTRAQEVAEARDARNFVVEFGPFASRIASNVKASGFEQLMSGESAVDGLRMPTRWINLWAPNTQRGSVEAIGRRYGFSPRLLELLCTAPPPVNVQQLVRSDDSEDKSASSLNDVELGIERRQDTMREVPKGENKNFFDIARNFTSYQSIDIGERDKFICIGSNWMHPLERDFEVVGERLWSWLILCDDSTVISVHEDLRVDNAKDIKALRAHILMVLRQLSEIGRKNVKGVDVISLRQPPTSEPQRISGPEGASNLFYYLFDDWTSTYGLLKVLQKELNVLSGKIMAGLDPKQKDIPASEIIPGLYEIGKKLRSNQHLYKGYENLITRILKYGEGRASSHGHGEKRLLIAQSACHRFERLQDHITFLVLNYLDEAIGEKDGLYSTYFNITAQKDSRATAKLSSNATLLSKLGVLFLPVSLMTSYFSIQIQELQGVYTAKTYWISFAVIMVLSFVALFIFSSVLVGLSTSLSTIFKAPIKKETRHLKDRGRSDGSHRNHKSTQQWLFR